MGFYANYNSRASRARDPYLECGPVFGDSVTHIWNMCVLYLGESNCAPFCMLLLTN